MRHDDSLFDKVQVFLGRPVRAGDGYAIYCADCLPALKALPNDFFSLTVTSPPYNIGKEYETTPVRLSVCITLANFPPDARQGLTRGTPIDLRTRDGSHPRSQRRHRAASNGTVGPGARRAVYLVGGRSRSRISGASFLRRDQLRAGGSLVLALSFSRWAITSSRVAHPCRYRQSISKVRSVGLPPVQRWINRQAMIAQ